MTLRIIATHPKEWSTNKCAVKGVAVRHVEVGAPVPHRLDGSVSHDGIGQVVTTEGFENLRDEVTKFKPHVLMFGIHMGLDNKKLRLLRRRCGHVKFVMHYTDQRPSVSKWINNVGKMLDLLLITNNDKRDFQMYKNSGYPRVRTFYDGVSPEEYWPVPKKPRYDCFFGGNNFWGLNRDLEKRKVNHPAPWIRKFSGAQFRENFLLDVGNTFDLIIRGQWGWDRMRDKLNIQPMLFHPNYLSAMREAKIVLNTINVDRHGLLTRRFMRSIASGRLFMTQYCSGIEKLFRNREHLVYFRTIEEGLDLIRYYLDHDNARERIARNGRASILKSHTHKHRLVEFVQLLREVFGGSLQRIA